MTELATFLMRLINCSTWQIVLKIYLYGISESFLCMQQVHTHPAITTANMSRETPSRAPRTTGAALASDPSTDWSSDINDITDTVLGCEQDGLIMLALVLSICIATSVSRRVLVASLRTLGSVAVTTMVFVAVNIG